MSRFHQLLDELGVPMDAQLFELALTHRSWAYENGGVPTNERLEFLGDSVLGVVVTEHLYHRFPDAPESTLAKLRAAVVSGRSLAEVARRYEIGPLVKLGQGEINTAGSDKTSILADTLEALIGAARLSGSLATASRLVHHLFDPQVETAAELGAGLDWKTSLQELCATRGLEMPVYEVTATGPEHDRRFVAVAIVGGEQHEPGRGRTKRHAEMEAASHAFAALSPRPGPAGGDA
ncbi:ribonuclease III [Aestuariimicrobium ganziense]|uniref:ribonuclease III n=1 Tax=Aestuariimicrobium ganziense TaxID=2773677 RepID=UPI0019447410|nr:ribonuclease III [Aestuariimicrobium ganziense]